MGLLQARDMLFSFCLTPISWHIKHGITTREVHNVTRQSQRFPTSLGLCCSVQCKKLLDIVINVFLGFGVMSNWKVCVD